MPTTNEFRAELQAQISRAHRQGRPHVEINAGELHRTVGGYPPQGGGSHAMPSCCAAMRDELARGRADIIHETQSGQAAALTIRYYLPR
jgi:hypothetical protein